MFGIKDLKIGTKIVIAPAIVVIFLFLVAVFSNNALKSDRDTLHEIVDFKFQTYKASSNLLKDINLYNSVLYKVFSYVSGGYQQNQIDEQMKLLEKLKVDITAQLTSINKAKYLDEQFAQFRTPLLTKVLLFKPYESNYLMNDNFFYSLMRRSHNQREFFGGIFISCIEESQRVLNLIKSELKK